MLPSYRTGKVSKCSVKHGIPVSAPVYIPVVLNDYQESKVRCVVVSIPTFNRSSINNHVLKMHKRAPSHCPTTGPDIYLQMAPYAAQSTWITGLAFEHRDLKALKI